MMQSVKRFSWLVLLAFGLQGARAFTPMEPVGFGGDAWQTPAIGYNPDVYLDDGLDTGPANLGQQYRRNTPVLYYAYDANFLDFFGSNGVVVVDSAFGILNSLTNMDNYSRSLTEFPEYSQQYNYAAQAAGLLDLKSMTLNALVLQLGLEDPQRYVWTLHDAYLPANGKCPIDEEFEVVQRNYDDYDFATSSSFYSPYINGTLFTYSIFYWPGCKNPGEPYNFVTENVPVDPYAKLYSAVASDYGPDLGGFYTGLTRDDVACLRYDLTTNNINWETAAAGSVQLTTTTNSANPQLFPVATGTSGVLLNGTGIYYGTSDLGGLISASLTNDAAALELLYPGVTATTVSNYFGVLTITNVTSYYTNYIGSPVGAPPILVYATNYTYAFMEFYVNTFANVITNHFRSNSVATLLTTTVGSLNGSVGNVLVTNTTVKTVILTNVPSGDYYILTNTPCGVSLDILATVWTNVVATTNVLVAPSTNGINTNGYSYSQSLVTYLTNYVFVTAPVTCTETAGSTGLYEGIENIKFVKASYDSLVGQFFQPITNNYTMIYVTNSQPYVQNFQRVVTAPDVLMTAADISGPLPGFNTFDQNTPNFNTANALPGEAGPGTIDPPSQFTYNSAAPIYLNLNEGLLNTNAYLTELTQMAMLAWGSFDGSTNPPVVYPSGSSIQNLQNQIILQIQPPPPALPDGTNGVAYPATIFTTSGGGAFLPPFTWTVPGGGLPQGLSIVSNPDNTATLSGTPANNTPGTYDFILQMNDSLTPPRTVQWNYSITIY